MTTLVIDRETLPEPLLAYIGASRIMVKCDVDRILLTPAIEADCPDSDDYINPDDFNNDTDYINAVPGLAEKILAARNAPASERERVPRELFHV